MNIKDKAIEIAGLCNGCLQGKDKQPDKGCSICEMRGAYYGAMDMGKWFMEKACDWLMDCAVISLDSVVCEFDSEDLVKRFREAMAE